MQLAMKACPPLYGHEELEGVCKVLNVSTHVQAVCVSLHGGIHRKGMVAQKDMPSLFLV